MALGAMPVAAGNGRCPLLALWGAIGNGELTKAPSGPSRDPAHIRSPLRFGHEHSDQLIRRSKYPLGRCAEQRRQRVRVFRRDHGKAEGRRYYGEWNGREAKLNPLNRTGPTAQPPAGSPLQFTPHKAGVVGDGHGMAAARTSVAVTAECCRATTFDGREDLQVQSRQPRLMFLDEAFAYRVNDIGHLERWSLHHFFLFLFLPLTPSGNRFSSFSPEIGS